MFYYNIIISINGKNEVTVHFIQFTILIVLKFNLNLQGLLGNKKNPYWPCCSKYTSGKYPPEKPFESTELSESDIWSVCAQMAVISLSQLSDTLYQTRTISQSSLSLESTSYCFQEWFWEARSENRGNLSGKKCSWKKKKNQKILGTHALFLI